MMTINNCRIQAVPTYTFANLMSVTIVSSALCHIGSNHVYIPMSAYPKQQTLAGRKKNMHSNILAFGYQPAFDHKKKSSNFNCNSYYFVKQPSLYKAARQCTYPTSTSKITQ